MHKGKGFQHMFKILSLLSAAIILSASNGFSFTKTVVVNDHQELENAIQTARAGDEIVLANGVWQDVKILFYGKGTEDKPIKLRAETPGKVSIEGESCLKIGGEYLVVEGLYFKNGYTPDDAVIEFRIDDERIANHCRVTHCVIEDFTQLNRYDADHWVEFWGRHNQLDHCYIAGKSNQGPTIRVYLSGNENIRNYHQITNNHFGPRPRKGGPKAETMQIGASNTSMTPSYINVSNNLFERCNGEVEVISSKSNFNEFRNNIFFECEGSLVMRHGNYCVVDGNFFIGSDESDFVGGIRVINTGHWVTNNYFYKLKADEFRAPLALMNGIPKSPLNRYNQVTDVVVAYNSWIDCETPWHISVGANMDKKEVLPDREIRSARPTRVVMANNLIYNEEADELPLKAYDKVDGIEFKGNVIDNRDHQLKYEGIKSVDLEMEKLSDWLFVPATGQDDALQSSYQGFGFEEIETDIFGNSRKGSNRVGAISGEASQAIVNFNIKEYGAKWFSVDKAEVKPQIHKVTAESISGMLEQAKAGDILELAAGTYQIEEPLVINKQITIRAKNKTGVTLSYSGAANSALFEMHPKGNLVLQNVSLQGKMEQFAFGSKEKNMSAAYNISLSNCSIRDFQFVLKSYKGSFADSLTFEATTITNCVNGLVLAAESDDLGDYNAEFVTIAGCTFENVQKNVINFYRGGYDESTIGGNLTVNSSTFRNCGEKEESKILLKTRGIINVDLSNNTFKNNPVELVALLWGEKNNKHRGNDIINSGKIKVDQYLKQKLVY